MSQQWKQQSRDAFCTDNSVAVIAVTAAALIDIGVVISGRTTTTSLMIFPWMFYSDAYTVTVMSKIINIIWLNDFACCDWSIPGP